MYDPAWQRLPAMYTLVAGIGTDMLSALCRGSVSGLMFGVKQILLRRKELGHALQYLGISST